MKTDGKFKFRIVIDYIMAVAVGISNSSEKQVNILEENNKWNLEKIFVMLQSSPTLTMVKQH
ncbi:hypothetical protein SDC9_82817 [bioreactor metagenome]|uniref:Uncharacterized protein n=1 Tax=bioreactor metagenome TaxID=1076179 RepID=A0A644Z5X3_9ZZZZ